MAIARRRCEFLEGKSREGMRRSTGVYHAAGPHAAISDGAGCIGSDYQGGAGYALYVQAGGGIRAIPSNNFELPGRDARGSAKADGSGADHI